jgi:hypothetical protein
LYSGKVEKKEAAGSPHGLTGPGLKGLEGEEED